MKVAAIGDELTIRALRLAGIPGRIASSREEAERALAAALAPDAVVLVAESVARLIQDKVDAAKVARQNWLVLEIPSTTGVSNEADKTARLVSQAIGVKV